MKQPRSASTCDLIFLIGSLDAGGAERQLVLLAKELHHRGMQVEVMVLYAGGQFEGELRASGIPVVNLRKKGSWSNPPVLWRLFRHVRQKRPAVVHGYLIIQNLLLLACKPMLKLLGVALVCGVRAPWMDMTDFGGVAGLSQRLHNRLLTHADLVISNSAVAGRELTSRVPAARLRVVPNGIDTNRFCYLDEARIDCRMRLGLRHDDVVVGLVGRLDPVKRHCDLIRAVSPLLANCPKLRLLFIGNGDRKYRVELEEDVAAHGLAERVTWVPAMSAMAEAYSSLDVFCLPSSSEGFSNVIAEAMACGLPCVVTDVGDAANIVGDAGWIVPPKDPAALSHALSEAIEALPDWNRSIPRERIVERFSVNALVKHTLEALSPWLGTTA